MAHYAKIVEGKVINVIRADASFFDTFYDDSPGEYIQTSYNTHAGEHKLGGTPLRKNFAGVGHTYDATRDAFIPLQPYPSWTLDESTCQWVCPVTYPVDDKVYNWNETDQQWDEIT
jgi:hypothetical protein